MAAADIAENVLAFLNPLEFLFNEEMPWREYCN